MEAVALNNEDDKRTVGRPGYEPNDYDRGQVDSLNAIGFPHRLMSFYMKKDIKTLKKYYPESFEGCEREDKTVNVEMSLYYNAVYKLNFMAQIAWLRAHKADVYGDKIRKDEDVATNDDILDTISDNLPD